MPISRSEYQKYANKIVSVLSDEAFFSEFKKRVDQGAYNAKMCKKRLVQDISIDWIDNIEDALPNLDTIVRNPRKFIVQEEDIVDISLARSISTESVKHLAQHTNMISKVDDDGMVTPNKILNITKEESFEIYENRFLYTLLCKIKDFVSIRYDKIKKASATQDVLQLDIESRFNLPQKKISYHTEYLAQLSFDEVMQLDPDTLTKIERIAKIDRIITDFMSSSFAKQMRGAAPVRPPITRTNVILKEPNFKKALVLWQFIETYQATAGFATTDDIEPIDFPSDAQSQLKNMVALNSMIFENMYETEYDGELDDAEFIDISKAGDMDFKQDNIEKDEIAQKLDEEDVKAEEKEVPEQQDTPPEEEKLPDDIIEPEKEPLPPEEEIEKEVEMTPEAEDDDEEEEIDEEKLDHHLFDVRKVYARPEEDKLRQEEIARIRDAIDRCLDKYNKNKKEEQAAEDEYYDALRKQELAIKKGEEKRKKDEEDRRRIDSFNVNNALKSGVDDMYAAKIVLDKPTKKKADDKVVAKQPKTKVAKLDKDESTMRGSYDSVRKALAAADKPKKDVQLDLSRMSLTDATVKDVDYSNQLANDAIVAQAAQDAITASKPRRLAKKRGNTVYVLSSNTKVTEQEKAKDKQSEVASDMGFNAFGNANLFGKKKMPSFAKPTDTTASKLETDLSGSFDNQKVMFGDEKDEKPKTVKPKADKPKTPAKPKSDDDKPNSGSGGNSSGGSKQSKPKTKKTEEKEVAYELKSENTKLKELNPVTKKSEFGDFGGLGGFDIKGKKY